MEAVAYLGGAFALAGIMAFLSQLRRRVPGYKAGAALLGLGVVMIGAAYFVTWHRSPVVVSHPGTPSATLPSALASASGVSIPTTVAALAALPPDQRKVVMQQEIDRYNAVLDQAYRTLDLSLLPQVTTGAELATQQQQLGALKAAGTPTGGDDSYSITGIGTAPALGSVSVRTQGTERSWYLDARTLQPVGQPTVNTQPATYTLVPDAGVWKVEVVVLG